MLHMILAILKLIGILLAAVLGLLLLLILLVLFAPVRYECSGSRFSGAEGHVKVSWLLGAVCFRLSLQGKGVLAKVRLLGWKKQIFPEEEEKAPKGRKERKTPSGKGAPKAGKTAGKNRAASRAQPSAEREKAEEKPEGQTAGRRQEKEKSRAVGSDESEAQEKVWFPLRCWRNFTEAVKRIWHWIRTCKKKILGMGESLQKAKRHLERWIRLLTSDLVKGLFRRYKGYLFYLFRHIRPRRVSGSLRFGLGDPALTGQLTGILYLLLPAGCSGLELLPDFGASRLEGQVECKGHIRLCHVAYLGWKVFRDKELRRLIQKVKHKEE